MTTISALLLAAALGGAPQGEVLAFTTTWCGPCQKMSPKVSRLQRQGYAIRRIDGDLNAALVKQFRITGFPTFVLVVGGQEKTRIVGMTSEEQLRGLAMQIPSEPSPVDPELRLVDGTRRPADKLQRDQAARAELVADTSSTGKGRFALPLLGRRNERQVAEEREVTIRANNSHREVASVASSDDPLSSSTRIRVKDGGSINYGSGTVIGSQPGRSLVLTCGHIFRKVDRTATIEVDIISGSRSETFVGKVVDYDLESDVGLIAIPTEAPVAAVRVAPDGYQVAKGDAVQSVGCGGGELPSVQSHRVTAVNRYLGADNIECTGLPIQGRSGGGLFSAERTVIGVCNAADPQGQRGIYAGLKEVHQLLDRCQLAALYRRPAAPSAESTPRVQLASAESRAAASTVDHDDPTLPGSVALEEPEPTSPFASLPARFEPAESPFAASQPSVIAADDNRSVAVAPFELDSSPASRLVDRNGMAAAASLQSAAEAAGDAEVVCIIRSIENPQAASRVVIINRASSKFVSYLSNELNAQPRFTSATVPAVAEPAGDHDLYRRSDAAAPVARLSTDQPRQAEASATPEAALGQERTETGSSWGHVGRFRPAEDASQVDAMPSSYQRYRRSSSRQSQQVVNR